MPAGGEAGVVMRVKNQIMTFIVTHAGIEMQDWYSKRVKSPFPRALWLDDVSLMGLLEGLNELRH